MRASKGTATSSAISTSRSSSLIIVTSGLCCSLRRKRGVGVEKLQQTQHCPCTWWCKSLSEASSRKQNPRSGCASKLGTSSGTFSCNHLARETLCHLDGCTVHRIWSTSRDSRLLEGYCIGAAVITCHARQSARHCHSVLCSAGRLRLPPLNRILPRDFFSLHAVTRSVR